MRYTVEDTAKGFRLTAQVDGEPDTRKIVYEEEGGNGLVEDLYAKASVTWLDLRAIERAREAS